MDQTQNEVKVISLSEKHRIFFFFFFQFNYSFYLALRRVYIYIYIYMRKKLPLCFGIWSDRNLKTKTRKLTRIKLSTNKLQDKCFPKQLRNPFHKIRKEPTTCLCYGRSGFHFNNRISNSCHDGLRGLTRWCSRARRNPNSLCLSQQWFQE